MVDLYLIPDWILFTVYVVLAHQELYNLFRAGIVVGVKDLRHLALLELVIAHDFT